MKKLFILMSALLLWQTIAVAQNYLHVTTSGSTFEVRAVELDSVTVRDKAFYDVLLTPSVLNGTCYTGVVTDAFSSTYTFDIKLVSTDDTRTMYVYDLDPFFAMNGYVASAGRNILQGKLVTSGDGKSATLTCEGGQPLGYDDVVFINPYDASQPIVFSITENTITCETGYGAYTESQGGFYSAYGPFTLTKSGVERAQQKAPVMRKGAAVPTAQPELKLIPFEINRAPQMRKPNTIGKAQHTQLMEVAPREITELKK